MRSFLIISRVVAAVFNRGQLKSSFATLVQSACFNKRVNALSFLTGGHII